MHTNESTAAQDLTTRAYYCPQAEQSHIPGLRAAGNRFSASAARGSERSTRSIGAAGALNERPLRDLSMIYRLWTGIRLEEAMRWQRPRRTRVRLLLEAIFMTNTLKTGGHKKKCGGGGQNKDFEGEWNGCVCGVWGVFLYSRNCRGPLRPNNQ